MSYPFFSGLSVFLPGYPFYLTAFRFFVSFRRKQKKDPFYTKTRLTRCLRNPISQNCRKQLVPKCFLPSSLISHWKTTCLFHKNRGWPGIFRANHHCSQFLVLVFFQNDGSNSKSHFLNESKNDDGFLASLGANRRRSYFHSVFHILILTIVPEGKNWPNPCE